ncbi:MAG: PAS domain-containing protein [Melioribacteraceae bacterium]|nr:PAS domain-containing protein [Melioribacteraceae bacterium]
MKSKNKKDNLSLPNTKHSLNSKLKSADGENDFYENIVNTVREPLLILDKDLRVVKANQSFFDFFKVNPAETVGTLIYNLGNNQWDIPKLRELLETILPRKQYSTDLKLNISSLLSENGLCF